LQSFIVQTSNAVKHSICLVTPSSMLIDRTSGRLILSELSTGRLVWLPVPRSLTEGGYIYFSETGGGRIGRANLDGTGKVTLLSGLPLPVGPALDLARGQMYWGEIGSGTMRRANLDGTGQTTIIIPNGGSPNFDLAGGRMYWSVSGSGTIRRANLDGSGQQVLITGLSDPHAVVLDLVGAKMYWANYGGGDVRRANLDGTGQQTLVAGPANSSLVALDVAGGKMYWTVQQANGNIRRANLDGSSQEILVRNQNAPSGIALDINNGHIYWANFGGGDIRRANLDGTGQQILLSGLSGLAVIALDLSPLRTPDIQTAAKTDSTFTLSWSALMGRGYQVQFKADLTQTNWTNSGGRRTATNTTMTSSSSIGSDPQRVYRVGLLP
jgi:outer membrane protein assembly factor BamB